MWPAVDVAHFVYEHRAAPHVGSGVERELRIDGMVDQPISARPVRNDRVLSGSMPVVAPPYDGTIDVPCDVSPLLEGAKGIAGPGHHHGVGRTVPAVISGIKEIVVAVAEDDESPLNQAFEGRI